MTDKADALARRYAHTQILIKGRGLASVAKRDVLESDFTRYDVQTPRVSRIRDPVRLAVQLHHLLHFIHSTLQLMNVLADVAQIAVNDEVGSEYVSDFSG